MIHSTMKPKDWIYLTTSLISDEDWSSDREARDKWNYCQKCCCVRSVGWTAIYCMYLGFINIPKLNLGAEADCERP